MGLMALLLRLARSPVAGWFIAFILAHAAFLLPAERLYQTRSRWPSTIRSRPMPYISFSCRDAVWPT